MAKTRAAHLRERRLVGDAHQLDGHFEDVTAGETYIISARGKRYSFSQPLQVLSVSDETRDVNFIAYPN